MLDSTSNTYATIEEAQDDLLDNDDFSNDSDFGEANFSLNESILVSLDEVGASLSLTSLGGDELSSEAEQFNLEPSFSFIDDSAPVSANFLNQELLDNWDNYVSYDSEVSQSYSPDIANSGEALSLGTGTPSHYFDFYHLEGTLEADTFTYTPDGGNETVVISGNGNLNYGDGYYDLLDLSQISVYDVSDYSFAEIGSGGTIIDTGNGDRIFDYMTLNNGDTFYFEGIDRIVFSDYEVDLTVDPDDPYYEYQWNLHMMGVQNAWRFTTGSEEVLVGVQDTGLGLDWYGNFHGDLGHTFYYTDNVTDEFSGDSSHGTAVQGIISAATDNGIGIAGINWNSSVFNIDVLPGID